MAGWTSLFRKTPRQKADASLRWFGKLPTYADYYSSKAEDDWAVEFNDWLLRGYELYHARVSTTGAVAPRNPQGGPVRRLPSAGLILRLPKSEMTVIAAMQDYGGDMRGRPFPLCFYVGVPTSQWPGPGSEQVGAAMRVLRDLMALRKEVDRFFAVPGRFEVVFGDRQMDLDGLSESASDTTWTQGADKLSMADWFTNAQASLGGQDFATWLGMVEKWQDNIGALESESFEPTFGLPLSAGGPLDVQVAGWLRWLERKMDLKRRALSLLISDEPGEAPPRLTVVARAPVYDDFLLLTPLAGSLSYLDDLGAAKSADGNGTANGDGNSSAIEGTWADFVEHRLKAPRAE